MNEETKPVAAKPVTGSNEQIEQRLTSLESGGSGTAANNIIEQLRNDIFTLQSDVQALRASVSNLIGTLGTVQTNVGSLQSSVSSLNFRVDAQKAHIESLERVNPAG